MPNETKQIIFEKCLQMVENQVFASQKEIAAAQEVANSETKSSAGDKYETTRAMMQIEIANCTKRLAEQENLQSILKKISFQDHYSVVTIGTLVLSNQGKFFISAGIGKIEIGAETYFAISQHSPLGEKLYQKKVGDEFTLNGRKYVILELL